MAKKQSQGTSELAFRYVKSNYHRVLHVEGAWGGVTPRGGIYMSVYTEAPSIPDRVIHELEGAKLGKELRRDGSTDIVREIEATLLMDLQTAIVVRDWLSGKIESAQKALKTVQESEVSESHGDGSPD